MICIVSYSDDLHALAIQRAVRLGTNHQCHILLADRIAQRQALSLRLQGRDFLARFMSSEDKLLDMADVGALWLRRPNTSQILPFPVEDTATVSLIDNDCTGGLKGFLISSFRGKWISHFDALIGASDKISQLQSAALAGFRTPNTLISQSKPEVVSFCDEHRDKHGIVVKTVVGGDTGFLLTRKLDNPESLEETAYEAAPAIYQENIPGHRHIRLLCFGDQSLAASIDSDDLDWRPNLNVPVSAWRVPDIVHRMTRETLKELNLEMGIVDLKETPDGQLVWLEVNPQGQFLFLEPLTQIPFAQLFAEYLAHQDRQSKPI